MEYTKQEIELAIERLKVNVRYHRRNALSETTEQERNYHEKKHAESVKRIEELALMLNDLI